MSEKSRIWGELSERLVALYGPLASKGYQRALYEEVKDLPVESLPAAFSKHFNGGEASYPPKPSHIRAHVAVAEVDKRKLERERRDALLQQQDAATSATVIDLDPEVARQAGTPERQVQSLKARCADCSDSGYFPFWLPLDQHPPAAKYDIYLSGELTPEAERRYRLHRAICDCERGQMRHSEQEHLVQGFEINGRHRRGRVLKKEALEVHRRRLEKGKR